MSSSRLFSFAAVSSLLLAVGCAAGPEAPDGEPSNQGDIAADHETAGDPDHAEDTAVDVDVATDTIGTQSGLNCTCAAGLEFQNGLCYTPCAAGYTGRGPVCWESTCSSGFTDTGAFCHRGGKIVSADTSSCPWYNKCGLGSSCSKCPSGYSNDGCTCRRDPYIYAKKSYGRGAGSTASCSSY